MRRSRAVVAASLALALDGGCMYTSHGLAEPNGSYKNYPKTVEEEHARRAHRRKLALIAGPLELLAGAGLTYLALFAPSSSSPPDDDGDDSGSGGIVEGTAKELAGRLLLGT